MAKKSALLIVPSRLFRLGPVIPSIGPLDRLFEKIANDSLNRASSLSLKMSSYPGHWYLTRKDFVVFVTSLGVFLDVLRYLPGNRVIFFARWYRMKDSSLLISSFTDECLNAAKVSGKYRIYVLKATHSQTSFTLINESDNTSLPYPQVT